MSHFKPFPFHPAVIAKVSGPDGDYYEVFAYGDKWAVFNGVRGQVNVYFAATMAPADHVHAFAEMGEYPDLHDAAEALAKGLVMAHEAMNAPRQMSFFDAALAPMTEEEEEEIVAAVWGDVPAVPADAWASA